MLLFMQIAGGTALGLLIALLVVEYFEEIVLTSVLFLGLGIPMIWVLTYLEGSGSILKKLVTIFRPLLSV
jgi:hypothetical protein